MLLRIGKNDLIARGVAHIAWQVLLEISKHLKGRLGPRVSDVTFLDALASLKTMFKIQ